jgi:hypothetical protein
LLSWFAHADPIAAHNLLEGNKKASGRAGWSGVKKRERPLSRASNFGFCCKGGFLKNLPKYFKIY